MVISKGHLYNDRDKNHMIRAIATTERATEMRIITKPKIITKTTKTKNNSGRGSSLFDFIYNYKDIKELLLGTVQLKTLYK